MDSMKVKGGLEHPKIIDVEGKSGTGERIVFIVLM